MGWTQEQLAAKAGIAQATISRLESGEIKDVKADLLFRLAGALKASPDYIKTGRGERALDDLTGTRRELADLVQDIDDDDVPMTISILKTILKEKK